MILGSGDQNSITPLARSIKSQPRTNMRTEDRKKEKEGKRFLTLLHMQYRWSTNSPLLFNERDSGFRCQHTHHCERCSEKRRKKKKKHRLSLSTLLAGCCKAWTKRHVIRRPSLLKWKSRAKYFACCFGEEEGLVPTRFCLPFPFVIQERKRERNKQT